MSDVPQAEEHRRRLGLPPSFDPRNFDPLKAVDPVVIEKMVRAQVAARMQATQTTTVFLATVVSLVTSAFGFVAALAWNNAIQAMLNRFVPLDKNAAWKVQLVYALIVTIIGVFVILFLNRIGRRLAKKSVIGGNGD